MYIQAGKELVVAIFEDYLSCHLFQEVFPDFSRPPSYQYITTIVLGLSWAYVIQRFILFPDHSKYRYFSFLDSLEY